MPGRYFSSNFKLHRLNTIVNDRCARAAHEKNSGKIIEFLEFIDEHSLEHNLVAWRKKTKLKLILSICVALFHLPSRFSFFLLGIETFRRFVKPYIADTAWICARENFERRFTEGAVCVHQVRLLFFWLEQWIDCEISRKIHSFHVFVFSNSHAHHSSSTNRLRLNSILISTTIMERTNMIWCFVWNRAFFVWQKPHRMDGSGAVLYVCIQKTLAPSFYWTLA